MQIRGTSKAKGSCHDGGSPAASIHGAKELGAAAAKEVAAVVKRPFQVHTADADARGDCRYKRIYAFVTTADGEDLAERLVRLGHARASGVDRETPAGKSASDYRAYLHDLELQAAKRIIQARPFQQPEALLNAEGIGSKTLERLRPFIETFIPPR